MIPRKFRLFFLLGLIFCSAAALCATGDHESRLRQALLRDLTLQENTLPPNTVVKIWPYRNDSLGQYWHVALLHADPATGNIVEPRRFASGYAQYLIRKDDGQLILTDRIRVYPENLQEELQAFRSLIDTLEKNPTSVVTGKRIKELADFFARIQALSRHSPLPFERFKADAARLGFILLNMLEKRTDFMRIGSLVFLSKIPASIPAEYATGILSDLKKKLFADARKTKENLAFQKYVVAFFASYYFHQLDDSVRWWGGFSQKEQAAISSRLRMIRETLELSVNAPHLPLAVQAMAERFVKLSNERINFYRCEALLAAKSNVDLN